MTWSLIARDPATKAFGIAVATKNFAVGCRVPFIQSGVGAIATAARRCDAMCSAFHAA